MKDGARESVLHFDALGSLRVRGETSEILISRPGYRRTLSWLLLDAGRSVDRDVLIDRLWPDDVPRSARNTLQHYIAGLRRILGQHRIRTVAHGYEIDLERVELDVREFDVLSDLVHRASRDGYVERAVSLADSALGYWRGSPFRDLDGDDDASAEIRRLERSKREIEELRLASLIDMGAPGRAIAELEALVLTEPLRERLWELLMLARYRTGEQAEALRAFQQVRRVLAEEVGLEPGPGLVQMERQIMRHDPSLTDVALPRRSNLPPAESELMGRSSDMAALRGLLATSHVVTITGPPGMGKTHLAIDTARSLLEEFEDGAWLVSLRSETTMQEVTRAFAAGLESDTGADLTRLTTHMRHLDALVVVDNAEHVAPECRRVVAEALKGADGLRFLVTSRAPIGVSAETVWRLRGLDTDSMRPDVLSPAADLLAGRIQMIESAFRVTVDNAPKLNAIAERADGVPLAMVLMASWLPAVGLDEVVDLLHVQPGSAETSHGPATIEDALEWSYRLLSPSDVGYFDSLAIFVASFDLDAAHAVAAPELDRRAMIGVMARLVEASLLETIRSSDGALRYRMLLPIRDHAIRRLEASDDHARVREAYILEYVARSVAFAASGAGVSGVVLGPIDQDIGDYRVVMQGSLDDGRPTLTADIAAALTEYWFARFLASEGRDWLKRAAAEASSRPTSLHSWSAGFLAYLDDDGDAAREHYMASLETASVCGDDPARARALFGLGRVQLFGVDSLEGAERIEEAIRIWADEPSTLRRRTEAHLMLGMRSTRLGASNDPHIAIAAELLQDVQDQSLASVLARYQSLGVWNRGEFEAAVELASSAVLAAREAGDGPKLCGALSQLAVALDSTNDARGAATAMLEALDIVERGSTADVAQVLMGSVPVLISGGHGGLAVDVLAMVDEEYELQGVGSVDSDLDAIGAWRAKLNDVTPDGLSGSDAVARVQRVLQGMANV